MKSSETYRQQTERDGADELEDGHLLRCHGVQKGNKRDKTFGVVNVGITRCKIAREG